MKVSTLTLEQLYNKPKITSTVEEAIREKEDFSRIQPEYCQKVCKLKCKSFEDVNLANDTADVVILQDHNALPEKYKSAEKAEAINRDIIEVLCRRNFPELTVRILNVVKCNMGVENLTKGKPPTQTTLLKCSPYLLSELKRVNPKVIISTTTTATKALGLNKSNYTNRGEIHGNVVLTLHPKVVTMIRQNSSGAMWGPDFWEVLDRDFNKAGRLANNRLYIPPLETAINKLKELDIWIAKSIKDVKEMMSIISSQPANSIISFDTETTGLDPWARDAKLLSIQFGFRNKRGTISSFVIPLWHRENKFYNPDEAWALVTPYLTSDKPKVGHHSKYDISYIWATTGVRVKGVVLDTMLVLHSINSGIQGTYGLKTAVWDWIPELGIGGYEEKLPKLTKIIGIEDSTENENV